MMQSDDLAPLLAARAGSSLDFASGEVTYWEPLTGHNKVRVNGAELTDLPILNNAASIDLAAGDVVSLLRYKSTFFILGRVIVPGAQTLAPAAIATGWAQADVDGVTLNTDWTGYTRASLSVPVPAGYNAGHFIVMASVGQTFSGTGNVSVRPTVSGSWGPAINSGQAQIAVAQSFWAEEFHNAGAGTAYPTIDFGVRAVRVGTPSGTGNYHVSASVIFQRED